MRSHKSMNWSCVALIALGTLAVGCSKDQSLVKTLEIRTFEADNGSGTSDGYVEFKAGLNTNNVHFPVFDVPIRDPQDPEAVYGRIWMRDVLPAGSELGVSVNVTKVGNDNPSIVDRTLPNGTELPIVGIDHATVLALPIGNKGIKAYGAFAEDVALLGAAIPIKQFDSLATQACPLNIMPSFNLGEGFRGIAGIFTGCDAGTSGVAVFVDAGKALENWNGGNGSLATFNNGKQMDFIQLVEQRSSDKNETKMYKKVMNLSDKYAGKRLSLN